MAFEYQNIFYTPVPCWFQENLKWNEAISFPHNFLALPFPAPDIYIKKNWKQYMQ